jgi:hypothetical protein
MPLQQRYNFPRSEVEGVLRDGSIMGGGRHPSTQFMSGQIVQNLIRQFVSGSIRRNLTVLVVERAGKIRLLVDEKTLRRC